MINTLNILGLKYKKRKNTRVYVIHTLIVMVPTKTLRLLLNSHHHGGGQVHLATIKLHNSNTSYLMVSRKYSSIGSVC